MQENNLIELISVSKYFDSNSDKKQKILDNINLKLKSGEIVAILGKSGSGKSTLLRIIAGLHELSKGRIKFSSNKVMPSISMVFQTFALFPWLNVIENVELGLESIGPLTHEKKMRAIECIKLIGLDGFEFAFPRELSGGMKQRVGFARGLATDPDILLLDEPFSALDILTSSALKTDFLKLWAEKKIDVKSVVIVTHSIEEAVLMSNRILVLGNSPATITKEFNVELSYPRDPKSKSFSEIVDKIYDSMTMVSSEEPITNKPRSKSGEIDIHQKLPLILPSEMFTLLELLNSKEYGGKIEISDLVQILHIKMQHIVRIIEGLTLFNFASLIGGLLKINRNGKIFIESNLGERKKLFAKHLLSQIGLSRYIIKIVSERPEKRVHKKRFKTHLEDYMTSDEATKTLNAVITWGRYGEIFFYDDNKQIFSLI